MFNKTLILLFFFLSMGFSVVEAKTDAESKAERIVLKKKEVYTDYIFAEENFFFLNALMVEISRFYDESDITPDQLNDQNEMVLLIFNGFERLRTQIIRHSNSPSIFDVQEHLMQLYSNAKPNREEPWVFKWYQKTGQVLDGISANDRHESLLELVNESVSAVSMRRRDKIDEVYFVSIRLGHILSDIQERFLRPKALRKLGYSFHLMGQNARISSDPSFLIGLRIISEAFRWNDTLWQDLKTRETQGTDLGRLFFAKDDSHYDDKWLLKVRDVFQDGVAPDPILGSPFFYKLLFSILTVPVASSLLICKIVFYLDHREKIAMGRQALIKKLRDSKRDNSENKGQDPERDGRRVVLNEFHNGNRFVTSIICTNSGSAHQDGPSDAQLVMVLNQPELVASIQQEQEQEQEQENAYNAYLERVAEVDAYRRLHPTDPEVSTTSNRNSSSSSSSNNYFITPIPVPDSRCRNTPEPEPEPRSHEEESSGGGGGSCSDNTVSNTHEVQNDSRWESWD